MCSLYLFRSAVTFSVRVLSFVADTVDVTQEFFLYGVKIFLGYTAVIVGADIVAPTTAQKI